MARNSWGEFQAYSAATESLPTDKKSETRQLINVYADFLQSERKSKRSTYAKQKIATINANQRRVAALMKFQTEADKIEGGLEKENLKGMYSLTETALKSWTDYHADTTNAYPKIIGAFRAAAINRPPAIAWGTVAGSIANSAIPISMDSPRFVSTFSEMNRALPVVQVDKQGNVQYDENGEAILTELGNRIQTNTRTRLIGPGGMIEKYQKGKESMTTALDGFDQVKGLLAKAEKSLAQGNQEEADNVFADAREKFKSVNVDLGAKAEIDPIEVAEAEQDLMERDSLIQKVEGEVTRLMGELGGESKNWKSLVKTEKFQRWADDRGIAVGYKTEAGKYMPGPNDEKAVGQWFSESAKQPGDYGLMLNQTTDEIVQISDKDGNIIGRGFRQPVHASDREGQIRILPLSGGTKVFDKDQIGIVDVVMKLPGGRAALGSPVRRRKMADAFKQLEATGDLTATRPSEEVAEGVYATRSLDQDEGYMSKAEYDRANAQADVEVGRFVIDKKERQAYVRFGDVVFAYDHNTQALTKVDDPAVIGKVMDLPSQVATKYKSFTRDDGEKVEEESVLMYSDMKVKSRPFSDELVSTVGALGYSGSPEETEKLLQQGRKQFLSSQGVETTDKPRELIKGRTYTSMGITFRDSEIPERYKGTYPDPKPGQGIDTERGPSGALPVSAVATKKAREQTHYEGSGEKRIIPKGVTDTFVGDRLPDYRVQKGDAKFMRELLAQEAADAGEPKPPAQAAKAAAAVKDRSKAPLPGEFSLEEGGVQDVATDPGGTSSYGRSAPPANSAAAAAAAKKKGEPRSPTPENANGKTDLNTAGEVKAASTVKTEKSDESKKSTNPNPEDKKKKKGKDATQAPDSGRSDEEDSP